MKKEIREIFRLYKQSGNTLEPVTLQLEGYGYKTIFKSEEEAKQALISNIDDRYKNGSLSIVKSFEIVYSD